MESSPKISLNTMFHCIMGKLQSKTRPSRSESPRTALMVLDDHLPQPDEDRKIADKAKYLQGYIDSHSYFYHSGPVPESREEILAILDMLFESDTEFTQRMVFYLQQPALRMVSLRIIIAKAIFMATDFYGNPETTLLPPEIVSIMTAFRATRRGKESGQTLCEWRRIGTFLLFGPHNKSRELKDSNARIDKMATSLDSMLKIFAAGDREGKDNDERRENLHALLKLGAEFGLLLFAQPCGWEVDWDIRPVETVAEPVKLHQSSRGSQQRPNIGSGKREVVRQEQNRRPQLHKAQGTSGTQGKIPQMARPRSMAGNESFEAHRGKDPNQFGAKNPSQRARASSVRSYNPEAAVGMNRTHQFSGDVQKDQLGGNQRSGDPQFASRDFEGRPQPGHVDGLSRECQTIHDPHATVQSASDSASNAELRQNERQQQPNQELTADAQDIDQVLTASVPVQSRTYSNGDQRVPVDPGAPTKTGLPIIYFPALLKTTDEYGRKLRRRLLVSESEVDKAISVAFD